MGISGLYMSNKSVARRPDYIRELKKVPGDYMHLDIDELTAKRMINLIAAGKSLSDEFIERMPVLYVGVSDFFSTSPLV